MKKIAVFLLLIALFISTVVETNVFAPELFSYGQGAGIQGAQYEVVIIYVDWGAEQFLFLMAGKKTSDKIYEGKIYQLLGNRITSYPPYNCSTATAYCYARGVRENWRGWVEFRGSKRAFCGGKKIKDPCLKMEY